MLILTRKPGESLYIGDNIKITIVEIKGHQIRVGIDAPTDLRIYREEIYLQILEENKKAAEAPIGLEKGLEGLAHGWKGRGADSAKSGETKSPLSAFGKISTVSKDPSVIIKKKKKRPEDKDDSEIDSDE